MDSRREVSWLKKYTEDDRGKKGWTVTWKKLRSSLVELGKSFNKKHLLVAW